MDNIKVSFLCLTYNHEKYISRAIESFLLQEVSFDIEIIICNNGSTDNTLRIVESFLSRYPNSIRVINHEKHINPTICSLELMRAARGQYLASCEGDDFWINLDKIKKQIEFLDCHNEYSGCVHNILIVDEEGNKIRKQKLSWLSNKKIFKINDFDGSIIPGHICSFVRRNVFLDKDKDFSIITEASEYIADRTNFLLLLENGPIYKMKDKMSAYRYVRKGENITSKIYVNNVNKTKIEFDYIKKLEDYCKNKGYNINFEKKKRILYANAIIDKLRYKIDGLDSVILNSCKNPLICKLSFPFNIIKKIIIKSFYVS